MSRTYTIYKSVLMFAIAASVVSLATVGSRPINFFAPHIVSPINVAPPPPDNLKIDVHLPTPPQTDPVMHLHRPDGSVVAVGKSMVVSVTENATECPNPTNTMIWLLNGRQQCVRDKFDDVLKVLQ